MPFGNRTGPRGQGPMTGRGLGYCAGYPEPGFTAPYGRGLGRGLGRGFGMGRGWGRGYGWGYYYPSYPSRFSETDERNILQREKEILGNQLEALKEEMKRIGDRIGELEKKKNAK